MSLEWQEKYLSNKINMNEDMNKDMNRKMNKKMNKLFDFKHGKAKNICKFYMEECNECSKALYSLENNCEDAYEKFRKCVLASSKYTNEKEMIKVIVQSDKCDYFTKNICRNIEDDKDFYNCMMMSYHVI